MFLYVFSSSTGIDIYSFQRRERDVMTQGKGRNDAR